MELKKSLKINKITQEAFAKYLGLTRVGLNKKLNRREVSQSLVDSFNTFLDKKKKEVRKAKEA